MSTALTPKSTRIWPTITVPDDSESLLWSGPIRTTLTQLADRTDYAAQAVRPVALAGLNSTTTSSTSYVDVTTVSLGTLAIGDRVTVSGFFETGATTVSGQIVITDTVDTTILSLSDPIALVSGWSRIFFVGGLFTASRATAHTLKIQHKVSSGTDKLTVYNLMANVFKVFP